MESETRNNFAIFEPAGRFIVPILIGKESPGNAGHRAS